MQIKPSVLLFFCGVVIGTLAIFYNLLTKPQTKLLSPIADRSVKVLGEKIIPTATPSPTPTPTIEPTPTSTPTPPPVIVAPSQLEQLFMKYSNEYSINKELLIQIANCESGLNPNAVNRDYAGLYQFTESLWIQTRQLMGQNPDSNLRFNPEESIRTAAFIISQGHLSIWPACSK